MLPRIFEEQINIVILHRALPADVALSANAQSQTSRDWQYAWLGSPTDDFKNDLRRKLPEPSSRRCAGSDDIATAAEAIAFLFFDTDTVGIRLRLLTAAMCPRFHCDNLPGRLSDRPYVGPGSEWLPENALNRAGLGAPTPDRPEIISDPSAIQRLHAGDIALLKGSGWVGCEEHGLVHRSPSLEAGQKRLLLTIDPLDRLTPVTNSSLPPDRIYRIKSLTGMVMDNKLLLAGVISISMLTSTAYAESLGNLAFSDTTPYTSDMTLKDDFTIAGDDDLMAMDAINSNGYANAIIEIPTGTSAKWEVSKEDPNAVYWEYKDGEPRIVNYLGYPGNYGAIPGTALPKELGGDGDPLDVIVLGQALPRGEVVDVRVIGVLKMLDDGEQDDKLVAVLTQDSPFAHIESMQQLDSEFPGVSQIVDIWFANYKGPDGGMEGLGFEDAESALAVLAAAAENFSATQ